MHGEAIRTGDEVTWTAAIFEGSWRKPKFVGHEEFSGTIIKHSYGKEKGQHTFTVLLDDGKKKLVKGRNLYPNLTRHIVDENSPDRVKERRWFEEKAKQIAESKLRANAKELGNNGTIKI